MRAKAGAHALKKALTGAIFSAVADNPHFSEIEGLHSIECTRVSDFTFRLHVQGREPGAEHHYYVVKVIEPQGPEEEVG